MNMQKKKLSKTSTIMNTNFQKLHTRYPFNSRSNHNPWDTWIID